MKITTGNPDIIDRQIDLLTRKKIPFIHEIGRRTEVLRYLDDRINYSDNILSFEDLAFIQKVKAHVKKQSVGKEQLYLNSDDINYYKISNIKDGEMFTNCYEVDLKHAYWCAAWILGYIDFDLFEEGEALPPEKKYLRLMALGSLATTKLVWYFDGEHYEDKEPKEDKRLKSFYFHISKYVDDLMSSVYDIFSEHVLFYWVDALFLSSGTMEEKWLNNDLIKKFKDSGFQVKGNGVDFIGRKGDRIVFKKENEPPTYVYDPIMKNDLGTKQMKRSYQAFINDRNIKK